MNLNELNKTKEWLGKTSEIRDIYIGLDVSTSSTGISILFNRNPVFLTACKTKNTRIGDGMKMVEAIPLVIKTLHESGLNTVLKELREKELKPFFIIVVENGFIKSATTSRKLSLWSGLWAGLFSLIAIQNKQQIELKFISAREWQERVIPWTAEERYMIKKPQETERVIKQKSLARANEKLGQHGVVLDIDDISDAYNISTCAYSVNDFSKVVSLNMTYAKNTKKLNERRPKVVLLITTLEGKLQTKKSNKILQIQTAKNSKYDMVEFKKKSILEFANKVELENHQKWNQELKDISQKLEKIVEDKKIKNKT